MKQNIIKVLITALILLQCIFVVCAEEEYKAVIVGYESGVNILSIESCGDVKYQYNSINAVAITVSMDEYERLQTDTNVAYIEEDGPVFLLEETLEWNIQRIGADMVWGVGNIPEVTPGNNTGAGVKVAIIDTGIDKDHPDLIDNIAGGISYIWNDTKTAPNDNWDDGNGHGTHIAGVISAVDNDIGVIGVAPGAQLYGVKVLGDLGYGTVGDVVAGIEWAIENDMDVISLSLGAKKPYESLGDACDNAYNAGIVIVAGSGNDCGHVIWPAAYDSVIAVGATTTSDGIAYYSNHGPEIELVAPGKNIYSTWNNGGYIIKSGTSVGTPHVTGTVALVLNTPITVTYDVNNNNQWDPVEVRQRLKDTATDLGAEGWDEYYGFGLVNAYEATKYSNEPPNTDWNQWDDDCQITNAEISMAEWHWATNTPVNEHIISNAEISLLEYQWVTADIC